MKKNEKAFIDTYKQEVTEERKEQLEKDLKKIPDTFGKIKFLQVSVSNYLKNVSPQVLNVSGNVNYPNFPKGSPLFWDRYLSIRMEELKNQLPEESENIDWIGVFESIDMEKPRKPESYCISTMEQKENYFSKASFNLTIDYLTKFKQETCFLNPKRKLEYIVSLNIERPKAGNTESHLFNQTVFQAQNNYFEFLTLYKSILESTTSPKSKKKTPTAPVIALFCNLINEAEIHKRQSNEIPEKYCKRICENYRLTYTDRVRQNFNGNKTKKHYNELNELILPCIDNLTNEKIQKHLSKKEQPSKKLYA